jgi:hypothetical protein
VVAPFSPLLALLCTIPGVDRRTAEVVLAEIGTDMARFPTAGHLASWAGLCPGNNESAGKHASGRTRKGSKWLRTALVQVANAAARSKGTYLAAQYARIKGRRGHKKAIVAVAHSILVICVPADHRRAVLRSWWRLLPGAPVQRRLQEAAGPPARAHGLPGQPPTRRCRLTGHPRQSHRQPGGDFQPRAMAIHLRVDATAEHLAWTPLADGSPSISRQPSRERPCGTAPHTARDLWSHWVEPCGAMSCLPRSLRWHARGQGFKSPQLHSHETAGQLACGSSFPGRRLRRALRRSSTSGSRRAATLSLGADGRAID